MEASGILHGSDNFEDCNTAAACLWGASLFEDGGIQPTHTLLIEEKKEGAAQPGW